VSLNDRLSRRAVGFHPGIHFWIFLFSNLLLSYFSFGLAVKVWIVIMGVLLPFGAAVLSATPCSPVEFFPGREDGDVRPRLWVWILLVGLALFLRFYRLVSLPAWPMWDDALCSFYSIRQMLDWKWQLHYSTEMVPPFFFWAQALFFRFFPPGLSSLWLFQQIQSVAALGVGYWACRRFFRGTLAFYFFLIMAFSFWFLYLGQFCGPEYLTVILEFASFGLLGLYLGLKEAGPTHLYAFLLGSGLASGFYVWVNAVPAVAILGAGFVAEWFRRGRRNKLDLLCFLVPFAGASLPMLFEMLRHFSAGHFSAYLALDKPFWEWGWLKFPCPI
jgi:hypothetical protein